MRQVRAREGSIHTTGIQSGIHGKAACHVTGKASVRGGENLSKPDIAGVFRARARGGGERLLRNVESQGITAAPKPAREAVFFILAHAVGDLPSCAAACERQPQARIAASPGLQRAQSNGTTFACCSCALHRSNKTAPARPQKPPQRPARAEHHRAPKRRL